MIPTPVVPALTMLGSAAGLVAAVLWILVAHRARRTGLRVQKTDWPLIVALIAFGMALSGRAFGRAMAEIDADLGGLLKELFFAGSSVLMALIASRLLFSAQCDGGEPCCTSAPPTAP